MQNGIPVEDCLRCMLLRKILFTQPESACDCCAIMRRAKDGIVLLHSSTRTKFALAAFIEAHSDRPNVQSQRDALRAVQRGMIEVKPGCCAEALDAQRTAALPR